MSTSVRAKRRGRGVRLFLTGGAMMLASGASLTALLAIALTASGNLAVAAANRPQATDGWRPAGGFDLALQNRGGDRIPVASAGQRRLEDAFRSAEAASSVDEALGERLAAAFSKRDQIVLASAEPPSADEPVTPEPELAARPRVIAPAEPVLASATPATQPVRLAALDPAPVVSSPVEAERPVVAELAVLETFRPTPFPRPRPADFVARIEQQQARAASRAEALLAPEAPAPRPTALAYAAPGLEARSDGPGNFFRNLLNHDETVKLPGRASGIAVYDIASATVRLPNGERLEAHSGLAHRQDNPAYVREKNRGPTPPNVYDMRMREALFHGTEAIRLTPRDQKKVFNRDGLLAHSYMYAGGGPRSQSNGCVVFKDYGRFLRAFKAGEIARLVVVPNMAELKTYLAGL